MLTPLQQRDGWAEAVENLKDLAASAGESAQAAAADYANVYQGRRGAMVVDVVTSRRRKYDTRVLPLVARWESQASDSSLRSLAAEPLAAQDYGLTSTEPATIQTVAANLSKFATDQGASEDDGCRLWAQQVEELEHAHRLDPVVGCVSGIGPALFAYMRMRCGANALKPDVRVARALRNLGFTTPGDQHSVLVIARGAAAELGIDLLSLDQLLWHNRP